MVTIVLTPLLAISVIGLILSIVAHGAALLGLPQPLGAATWGLHVAGVVLGLPAVFVGYQLTSDFKRRHYWTAALRGCPQRMRWLLYGFFAYAIINFLTFIPFAPPRGEGGKANTPPVVFRGFSGHWMAFYSAYTAIFYSAIVVAKRDPARRCPNGHPVSPSASFCEACGAAVSAEKAVVDLGDSRT